MQKRAARFVTRTYSRETGSMTGILEELKWETLQKRRKDNRLILMYKGLKGKARILTIDLIPKNRRCRNQHSMAYQILSASTLCFTGPHGSVVEHPLWDLEVVGSNPGRAIPKALKMVPVATLLGAQYYKASTGFSYPNNYRTTNNATLTKQ